jgi:formate-dependent nitrite reductase cytochrome c552 subunit
MNRKIFSIIIVLIFAVGLFAALYPLWLRAQQQGLELVEIHKNAEGNSALCIACHGSRTDEKSLDSNIKPVHTLHLTNPLLNLQCTSCHKSVDLVNKSAAHLRRQVSMSICTTCHAEFYRKPLKVTVPERVAVLTLEAGYNEFSLPFDYTGVDDAAQVLEVDASKLRLATALGVELPTDYTFYPQQPADLFHPGRGYQI